MKLFELSKEISPTYPAKFWRSIIEFKLIQENDRIAVGFSGGKDSIYLLFLLASLKNTFPFPLHIEAFHIDNDFANPITSQVMKKELIKYCDQMEIPLTIHKVPMTSVWDKKTDKTPCYTCAKYRRGALTNLALEHNCNKLALAHHLDDAVETLMMSLFHSGQLRTFKPISYMDRSQITVIRPLVLLREEDVIEAVSHLPWNPIKNPCPHTDSTKRTDMREWLKAQEQVFPGLFDKLARSLREDQLKALWPPLPKRSELKIAFEAFWQKTPK